MGRIIASFVALFASFGLLLTGGGLLGTLLSVRMSLEAFPTSVIGLVAACYSLGFILATRVCDRFIRGVGHIRTFAALAALAASTTLVYPLIVSPALWAVMRLGYGFAIAGLYMVVESWLNDRTPNEQRGRIFGIYSVVTYAGLGGGQFLLAGGDPAGFELFSLSAILIVLALVPVTIARSRSPTLEVVHYVSWRELYEASPLGLVGAGMAGVINGAFLGLAPVFARGAGFSNAGVAALMGLTIVGGFLLQWPIGRLSDRYNRRWVIMVVSLAVAALSAAIVAATPFGERPVIALAVAWGGVAFTLYPLTVSLTNDFMAPSQLLSASAGLLLVHGVGMIIGPLAAALLMERVGPAGLFWTMAATGAALAAYAALRQRLGPAIDLEEFSSYHEVPRNTPYGSWLDPRSEPLQMEFDFRGDEPLGDEEAR